MVTVAKLVCVEGGRQFVYVPGHVAPGEFIESAHARGYAPIPPEHVVRGFVVVEDGKVRDFAARAVKGSARATWARVA